MEKTVEINKFVKMISECLDNNNFQQAEKIREELYYADIKATNEIYLTGRMIQNKKIQGDMRVSHNFTQDEMNAYIQIILKNKHIPNPAKKRNIYTRKNDISFDNTQFLWCWFHFFNSLSTDELRAFITCFHEDESSELRLLNDCKEPNDRLFFINEGSIVTIKKELSEFNILKIYEKGTIAGFEPFFLSPLSEDGHPAAVMRCDNKLHYIANKNTNIHFVVKSELEEVLDEYPDLDKKLSDFCLSYNTYFSPVIDKSG